MRHHQDQIINKSDSLTAYDEALLFAYIGSRAARYPIDETDRETQAGIDPLKGR